MVGRICLILDGKHLIIIIETTTLSLREMEGAEWVLRAPSSISLSPSTPLSSSPYLSLRRDSSSPAANCSYS